MAKRTESAETIVLDDSVVDSTTTVTKTEAQLREEILSELKLQGKLKEDIQPEKSDYSSPLEKPRRIIFEIKGVESDDSMYDGSHIAGKSVGIVGYKLISDLANRSISINDRRAANYLTGFEVDEIYESNLPDEVKQARIKDVKIARQWLERKYGQSLDKTNFNFWGDYQLKINDLGVVYDTHKQVATKNEDPLLLYYTVLGGGHPDIATSHEEAKRENKFYYITAVEEEAKRKYSSNTDRISANAELKKVMDNWSTTELVALTYNLFEPPNGKGYVLSTPKATIIQELSDFIEGVGFKTGKKEKPAIFISNVAMLDADRDRFMVKAYFNAASHYGFIVSNANKEIINKQTNFNYGSSKDKAIEKLLNPINIEELGYLKAKVTEKWRV